jgi:xanthosine utilization system XapX-like protein
VGDLTSSPDFECLHARMPGRPSIGLRVFLLVSIVATDASPWMASTLAESPTCVACFSSVYKLRV